MGAIRIMVDGIEYEPEQNEKKAIAVEMWYDKSRRNWVLYPVDNEGNQIAEAVYGFGKAEAKTLKAELEQEYGIK